MFVYHKEFSDSLGHGERCQGECFCPQAQKAANVVLNLFGLAVAQRCNFNQNRCHHGIQILRRYQALTEEVVNLIGKSGAKNHLKIPAVIIWFVFWGEGGIRESVF